MKRLLAFSAGLAIAMSISAASADVIRKGEGARRSQLNALELKPFAAANWAKLADWTNGAALDSASTSGKPVLIVTWAGWRDISVKALKTARKLSEKYGKDGLIVVGVHSADNWADAGKLDAPAGASFLLAHDSKGDFRRAILSNSDPEMYVIDRAGQMRFASITTESAEEAVEKVVKETSEVAAGTNDRNTAQAEAARIEAAKTSNINKSVDMTRIPEQPYVAPDEEAYTKAGFKKYSVTQADAISKFDEVKTLVLPDETYFPKKPEVQGRCTVVYFWSWHFTRSYDPAMQRMEALQRKYGRDVVFIGVWTPFKLDNIPNEYAKKELEEEQDPEKVIPRIRGIMENRKFQHSLLADPAGVILSNARSNDLQFNYFSVPYAAVASSEGVIRFQGSSLWPEFEGAIDEVVNKDPGIKKRRAAEDKWIKAQAAKPAAPTDGTPDATPEEKK